MADNKQKPVSDPRIGSAQLMKLAIDLGPLLVFFAVFLISGIYWATGTLMVLTVISMIASRLLLGHVSATLIVTTVLVVGFGSLTLWFNDPRFIKIKPTIVNLLFAAVLLGGVVVGKPLLRYVMGEALRLSDKGWRLLSIRFGLFFIAMAGLNEIIWRHFSETTWASFKVFGILPLTLLFFVTQLGAIQAHRLDADGQSNDSA